MIMLWKIEKKRIQLSLVCNWEELLEWDRLISFTRFQTHLMSIVG